MLQDQQTLEECGTCPSYCCPCQFFCQWQVVLVTADLARLVTGSATGHCHPLQVMSLAMCGTSHCHTHQVISVAVVLVTATLAR